MRMSVIYFTLRPGGYDILLDSLKNQSFKDFDLVIVDELIDRAGGVIKLFYDNNVKIKSIGTSKEKSFDTAYGLINAWNTGIIHSDGELLVFIGDYSWMPPDALLKFWLKYQEKGDSTALHGIAKYYHCPPPDSLGDINGKHTIFKKLWEGSAENNGWTGYTYWWPNIFEMFYSAIPRELLLKTNGFPECYDYASNNNVQMFFDLVKRESGILYVDPGNYCEMIEHRELGDPQIWHLSKMKPRGSEQLVPRKNPFNLRELMKCPL